MAGSCRVAQMSDYTTISLKKEFVADVEAHIEDEPFNSPKEFIKHLVIREMESEDEITEDEAKEIAQKLADLGYMD
jgi:Arc/MetJ-type ribon-helix-helix transcriptional regulator